MKAIVSLLAVLILAACASRPSEIQAAYVSPAQYQNYSCSQIAIELRVVSRRVAELRQSLDQEASADAGQMAAGIIIFWPALFFLEGGDGPEAQEYARLKGERNALEQVSAQKGCGIRVAETEVAVRAPVEPDHRPSTSTRSVSPGEASGDARRSLVIDEYGRCLVDAIVRYDDAEPDASSLVRRAQDACGREADAWKEIYLDQGYNRVQLQRLFSDQMDKLHGQLVPEVEDHRARGIPLSEIARLL